MERFILASASPARYTTLVRAGVRPEVIVSNFDEDSVTAPTARELSYELAAHKASAVATQIVGQALVLGCDSLLEFDGAILGKPGRLAKDRWRRMRGKTGVLWTGHCLVNVGTGKMCRNVCGAVVHFSELSDDDIDLYCSTGEPANVAGGFTIDGFGGWFIDRIDGDPSNVVGVSLAIVRLMLAEQGYSLRDIGYPTL